LSKSGGPLEVGIFSVGTGPRRGAGAAPTRAKKSREETPTKPDGLEEVGNGRDYGNKVWIWRGMARYKQSAEAVFGRNPDRMRNGK